MNAQRPLYGLIAISLALTCSPAVAADEIGFYTAVAGQVSVTHPGDTHLIPVKLHDQVLFKDVIETQHESRTKAFFQDDSILTVGEDSRVEINEYVYQPENNVRQAVVKLLQGQLRALVSKVFKANGSKFEVHTPTAVAAARGTYFTVWVNNGLSGIINIGETGRVDFTSGGVTVSVDPGYYSVANGGDVPSVPARHYLGQDDRQVSAEKPTDQKRSAFRVHDRGAAGNSTPERLELTKYSEMTDLNLVEALTAVERTGLKDGLGISIELPMQALQALKVDVRLLQALTTLTGTSIATSEPGNGDTASITLGTLRIGVTGASTSGGLVPSASLSVGSTTVSSAPVTSAVAGAVNSVVSTVTAPLTPVVSTVVAPVVSTVTAPIAPIISTVTAPIAPVISTVTAPVVPIISTVTAPIAPVISSVVAPVAPIVNTIIATPPAVINGALSRSGPNPGSH